MDTSVDNINKQAKCNVQEQKNLYAIDDNVCLSFSTQLAENENYENFKKLPSETVLTENYDKAENETSDVCLSFSTQAIENKIYENFENLLMEVSNYETILAEDYDKTETETKDFDENISFNTFESNIEVCSSDSKPKCSIYATPEGSEQALFDDDFDNSFSAHRYKNNDESIHFFTGLEYYDKMIFVYRSLGPSVENLTYIYGPPPKNVSCFNRFFLTLIILRQRKTYLELSKLFNITQKQVYNIFLTWIKFM